LPERGGGEMRLKIGKAADPRISPPPRSGKPALPPWRRKSSYRCWMCCVTTPPNFAVVFIVEEAGDIGGAKFGGVVTQHIQQR
jgi:hypothetical protein